MIQAPVKPKTVKTCIGFLLILVLFSACAKKVGVKQVAYNGENKLKANKEQIINQLQQEGVLEGIQTSTLDGRYEVVEAKAKTKYFITNGEVVSYIREPEGDETKLIYWKYKFKGSIYRDRELPGDGLKGHKAELREIACDVCGGEKGGEGIVYDPGSEQVKRVFYYENK